MAPEEPPDIQQQADAVAEEAWTPFQAAMRADFLARAERMGVGPRAMARAAEGRERRAYVAAATPGLLADDTPAWYRADPFGADASATPAAAPATGADAARSLAERKRDHEFAAEGWDQTITLYWRDGHRETYHIPALTLEKMQLITWYELRMREKNDEWKAATHPATARRLAEQFRNLQYRQAAEVIPQFMTPARFETLHPMAHARVARVIGEMVTEAEEAEAVAAGAPGDGLPN